MRAAFTPAVPPPMHDHLARQHARHAAEQHAAAAGVLGEEVAAHDARDMRPAISLIGSSSGRRRFTSTVS